MSETNAPAPAFQPLSLDEILRHVSEIARDGEGADKFRALKLLTSMQQGTVTLPPPLTDDEVVERIVRLMRSAGPALVQLAYVQSFPHARARPIHNARDARTHLLSDQDEHLISRCVSVKALYRNIPELKRGTYPRGYPAHGSLLAKSEFCKRTAREILTERRLGERLEHGREPDQPPPAPPTPPDEAMNPEEA